MVVSFDRPKEPPPRHLPGKRSYETRPAHRHYLAPSPIDGAVADQPARCYPVGPVWQAWGSGAEAMWRR
jgi:hypothetical protein